jgi:hypothetical protein
VVTFQIPYAHGTANGNQEKENRSSRLKKKDRLPSKEIPARNSSAGSSSAQSRGADATSKSAVEISAKGRDEPVVRNPYNKFISGELEHTI